MSDAFPFDTAVLIGRFQPFHTGHAALLQKALESAPQVLVVLGSSHRARSAKNPFTWEERAAMISKVVDPKASVRLHFLPVRDYYDDRRWSAAVTRAVQGKSAPGDRIALIGHVKDVSSYYLKLFPEWGYIAAGLQGDYSASRIRRLLFENADVNHAELAAQVPPAVYQCLLGWTGSTGYVDMRQEYLAIEESKKTWGTGPHITLDALVTCAGHVLLIRRGGCPGNGLWAIPGGFLEPSERLVDGAIRELCEETTLDLRDPAHVWALRQAVVFDHPDRSQRGRVITHAHHFDLQDSPPPKVKGADDASEAHWTPIHSLPAMEGQFFEDHFHILNHFFSIYT